MLSTLIYRSRAVVAFDEERLGELIQAARLRNARENITGILLFDGLHFVQLLEGPQNAVDVLYGDIKRDPRHSDVVHLLRDYAPARRFKGDPMALIDLRGSESINPRLAILAKMVGMTQFSNSDDRVIKILLLYVQSSSVGHIIEGDSSSNWSAPPFMDAKEGGDDTDRSDIAQNDDPPYQFALQPIVNPMRRDISSFEFLIRGRNGGSPEQFFSSYPAEHRYRLDIESKALAFRLAHQIGQQHIKVAVNLFPMSLMTVPDAVDKLVAHIEASGLSPTQVLVEITEQEAISCLRSFGNAIKRLRAFGVGVAIDDFGSGFAGLSLLAEFQPDKLKIDRRIIQDIHTDGPRQAIVLAIVQVCTAMGITPVAEGVESIDEWCWLQAAGIERFQGYLFAKPALNRIPDVYWPERRYCDNARAANCA
ncbi:diguanylate phosphodiesterase [Bordetella avium]|uniref:diguanylate phosphodiesterase n=1 Tax=Bordetella avium TaxID=521 RepID=UPI000E6A57A5|nr:diguanylate phosphodiesterase [Bordetella avium]RIQ36529.1 diguanylate phosphodiesterase [Bordetella avium]